ncbi:MAG: TrkH family potassium uptake protein [Coriobacteriia bacterium]|nr:TrkH family potassium uptake protein [Coriobacteriia bacterium]
MSHIRQHLSDGSAYGKLMIFVGLLFFVPLLVIVFFPDEIMYAPAFLLPAVSSVVLGYLVCYLTHQNQERTYEYQSIVQRGSLPVLFVWLYGFLLGMVSFLFTGQLTPVQALFESVSAWSSTGFTLCNPSTLPHVFAFLRSYLQFIGGVGFILVFSAFVRNRQTMSLYSAEGHSESVLPSLAKFARMIFLIYITLVLVGSLLLWLSGMELLNALCYTMSAVSTGGMSPHTGNVAQYDNLTIEIVLVILMFIGASNVATLMVLTEGKLKKVVRSTEMKFMLGMLGVFIPLVALSLFFGTSSSLFESIRQAVFGVVSIYSTTGFSTASYYEWPPFAVGLIMLLMIMGGSSGSTSGGIKLIRTYFILRITRDSVIRQSTSAIRTEAPTFNTVREKVPIDRALIASTFAFVACYVGLLIIGTLLITVTADYTLFEAMFEFTSAVGTIGISNGLTSTSTNAPTLIIEMIGMILGRLEIFMVFYAISSFVKRINWAVRNRRH